MFGLQKFLITLLLTVVLAAGCTHTAITKEQAVVNAKKRLDNYYNMQTMNLLNVTSAVEKRGEQPRNIWTIKFDCDCAEEDIVIVKVDKLTGKIIDWYASPVKS